MNFKYLFIFLINFSFIYNILSFNIINQNNRNNQNNQKFINGLTRQEFVNFLKRLQEKRERCFYLPENIISPRIK